MEAKRPRLPRERLASLKDPKGSRINRPARTPLGPRCPNPSCTTPDIQDADGVRVCLNCGTVVSESNIVSEVTFGETSAGAATVQGGFVGEGQRHAKSLGTAFRRAAGGTESREVTEVNGEFQTYIFTGTITDEHEGRDEIRKQANALSLNENMADQAFSIYKLAAANNFIQGRRVRMVASVCLYVACRRDPNNQTLLMDFSELIQVNVFKIGQTYQDLKKDLWLDAYDASGIRPVVEVENLIMKFARKLEFGTSLMKVAEDAARLVKRMKRDWMVTGRRPAGLCGACIILAARMNNFRRTVREVVYVVKVADMTVAKRIEEFKRTASSDLTVDQFREFGTRLKHSADPPALYEAKMKAKKKKRKLALLLNPDAPEEAFEISDDDSSIQTRQNSSTPAVEARRDADGFAIPAIPVDPSLLTGDDDDSRAESSPASPTGSTIQEAPAKRKPGRPKKSANPPPVITEDDLIAENELEDEIDTIINDPASLSTMEDEAFAVTANRAKALADRLRAGPVPASVSTSASTSTSASPSTSSSRRPRRPVSSAVDIDSDEFDSDPEVRNCVLSQAEQRIKERIWVTHNEDWLRAQQAKHLKKALDEASGVSSKRPKQKRRAGRMGDGSVLEGGTPVESPADANQRMLEKRGKGFSKHINYEKLSELYRGVRGLGGASGSGTVVSTEAEGESVVDGDGDGGTGGRAEVGEGGLVTPHATQEAKGKAGGNDEQLARGYDEEDSEEEEEEEEVYEDETVVSEKKMTEAFIADGDDFGDEPDAYDEGGDDPFDY